MIPPLLTDLGFPELKEVTGRASIADLFQAKERCGIYVLAFSNGEYYAGQAVDVVRRFGDHRKNHGDISHMTFQQVAQPDLNRVEQHVIHTLEASGFLLRNIVFMSHVQGERDLDLVVTPEEQEQWLEGTLLSDDGPYVEDQSLRRRYGRKYASFQTLTLAQDAIKVLYRYLTDMIPAPRRTELAFWSLTCRPPSNDVGLMPYYRVNLNMQEVLVVFEEAGELVASFHLASSPFAELLGETWAQQLADQGWEFSDHAYAPGGYDQFNFIAVGVQEIMAILENSTAAAGMCLMNLRLMRKGATKYSRYHCLGLVDAALELTGTVESDHPTLGMT